MWQTTLQSENLRKRLWRGFVFTPMPKSSASALPPANSCQHKVGPDLFDWRALRQFPAFYVAHQRCA
jgi:hypothetical protein